VTLGRQLRRRDLPATGAAGVRRPCRQGRCTGCWPGSAYHAELLQPGREHHPPSGPGPCRPQPPWYLTVVDMARDELHGDEKRLYATKRGERPRSLAVG
jgi:hypothetical protein